MGRSRVLDSAPNRFPFIVRVNGRLAAFVLVKRDWTFPETRLCGIGLISSSFAEGTAEVFERWLPGTLATISRAIAGPGTSGGADHSFELQPAVGVEVPLTDRVALQFVPAEYHLATPSNGATHGYTANLSVSWAALDASQREVAAFHSK